MPRWQRATPRRRSRLRRRALSSRGGSMSASRRRGRVSCWPPRCCRRAIPLERLRCWWRRRAGSGWPPFPRTGAFSASSCSRGAGSRSGGTHRRGGRLARRGGGAGSLGLPLAIAWAHRAAADVALAAGQPGAAAERAVASVSSAEQAGAVVEAALSRTLAGQAFALAGDRERAVVELERAAAVLDACGARPLRDAAERELRKLGRPVHRRTRRGSTDGVGVETLTARERQVAALVVDRKTNPEIAAELFLSLKTVETHMRNIFRKLDVPSRVELARAVERARRAA